jgi:serine/threonine-protein kinase
MRIVRTVGMAVLSIALLAGCSWGGSRHDPSTAPKPSAPGFEGTYRFDFDGTQQLAGGQSKPTTSRSRLYALRSTCTDTGCVATATKLADDNPHQKSDPPVDLVLDYIGGHWQMGLREESSCAGSETKGPSLTVWILAPQPDGNLKGTSSVAMNPSPDCVVATQTPVTVTRLSGVDASISVADPGKQAPLSPSAPDGLTGHYNETSVIHDSSKPGVRRVDMKTTCVRNTDHCATFKSYRSASGTPVVNSLLFDNGKWAVNQNVDVRCPNGATASTVKHEEYKLPKPVVHPLPRLGGSVRFDAAPSCPAQQLDISLERTGD